MKDLEPNTRMFMINNYYYCTKRLFSFSYEKPSFLLSHLDRYQKKLLEATLISQFIIHCNKKNFIKL